MESFSSAPLYVRCVYVWLSSDALAQMAELGAISPLGGRALENVFVTADAEDLARRCMHAGEMDAALASSVPQRAFIRRACEDARVRFHLHTQADPQSTHKRTTHAIITARTQSRTIASTHAITYASMRVHVRTCTCSTEPPTP
eukprot:6181919-Pleurochrysis_carterae.AAC.1